MFSRTIIYDILNIFKYKLSANVVMTLFENKLRLENNLINTLFHYVLMFFIGTYDVAHNIIPKQFRFYNLVGAIQVRYIIPLIFQLNGLFFN